MAKGYTDKEGYVYSYSNIEDLCTQIMCCNCPLYGACAMKGEQDSCEDYMDKLKELKKEGIK